MFLDMPMHLKVYLQDSLLIDWQPRGLRMDRNGHSNIIKKFKYPICKGKKQQEKNKTKILNVKNKTKKNKQRILVSKNNMDASVVYVNL